jgi:rhodanese-related sulfurtransferase
VGFLDWLRGRPAARITPHEAHARLSGGGDHYLLLDVRQPSEYGSGVAPGALLIPLTQLGKRLHEVPRGRQILCICASGHRSPLAARRLNRAGFEVLDVSGGMQAWRAAGLPLSQDS